MEPASSPEAGVRDKERQIDTFVSYSYSMIHAVT